MVTEWLIAVGTVAGAGLIVVQLAVGNSRQRREAMIGKYLSTVEQRDGFHQRLPEDRDEEAVRDYIAPLIEAERSGERQGVEEPRRLLVRYLNLWEALAVGVQHHVFDLDTLTSLAGTHILAIWNNYSPWIRVHRESPGYSELYTSLEWLAGELAATERERGHAAGVKRRARRLRTR